MDRIARNMEPSAYQIRKRSTVTKVVYHEILYIESSNSKCILHDKSGRTYTIYKTLNTVEKELGDRRFLRCHQSFLVNCHYIRTLSASQIELKDGSVIPVSKHRIKEVRKSFFDYMEG